MVSYVTGCEAHGIFDFIGFAPGYPFPPVKVVEFGSGGPVLGLKELYSIF